MVSCIIVQQLDVNNKNKFNCTLVETISSETQNSRLHEMVTNNPTLSRIGTHSNKNDLPSQYNLELFQSEFFLIQHDVDVAFVINYFWVSFLF
jgi:hypothetical protein